MLSDTHRHSSLRATLGPRGVCVAYPCAEHPGASKIEHVKLRATTVTSTNTRDWVPLFHCGSPSFCLPRLLCSFPLLRGEGRVPHGQVSQLQWTCLGQAQGGERALLPWGGTAEGKEDPVSLPGQVLLPSFRDPVLVNPHFESNASREGSRSGSPARHVQYHGNEMQCQSKELSQGSERPPISVFFGFLFCFYEVPVLRAA